MIDKIKTQKYVNTSDGINASCLGICLFFFSAEFIYLLSFWGLTFFFSGLALRRYCKGKGMMRFGTSSEIDTDDMNEIISSYNNYLLILAISNVVMVGTTIYHLYQALI